MAYNNYTITTKLSQDEINQLQALKRDTETTKLNLITGNSKLIKQLGVPAIGELGDDNLINDISTTTREIESLLEQINERLSKPFKVYTVDAGYIDDAKDALQRLKRRFEGLYE